VEQTGKAVFLTVSSLDRMKGEADQIVLARESMLSIAESVTGEAEREGWV
jgi:hypothetical protein